MEKFDVHGVHFRTLFGSKRGGQGSPSETLYLGQRNGMLISPSKDEAAVNGCQIPMIWLCTGSIGTGHTAELVVCAYLLNYLVLFKTISWNCLGVWSGFGI